MHAHASCMHMHHASCIMRYILIRACDVHAIPLIRACICVDKNRANFKKPVISGVFGSIFRFNFSIQFGNQFGRIWVKAPPNGGFRPIRHDPVISGVCPTIPSYPAFPPIKRITIIQKIGSAKIITIVVSSQKARHIRNCCFKKPYPIWGMYFFDKCQTGKSPGLWGFPSD